jgi:hypothetical protein
MDAIKIEGLTKQYKEHEKEFFIRSNAFGSIEFWIRVVRYD